MSSALVDSRMACCKPCTASVRSAGQPRLARPMAAPIELINNVSERLANVSAAFSHTCRRLASSRALPRHACRRRFHRHPLCSSQAKHLDGRGIRTDRRVVVGTCVPGYLAGRSEVPVVVLLGGRDVKQRVVDRSPVLGLGRLVQDIDPWRRVVRVEPGPLPRVQLAAAVRPSRLLASLESERIQPRVGARQCRAGDLVAIKRKSLALSLPLPGSQRFDKLRDCFLLQADTGPRDRPTSGQTHPRLEQTCRGPLSGDRSARCAPFGTALRFWREVPGTARPCRPNRHRRLRPCSGHARRWTQPLSAQQLVTDRPEPARGEAPTLLRSRPCPVAL